ncbi:hypothetical protein E8E12_005989 [Didymella heteroderae]|uniref:Uncharacterized protein n=1 Tax=Didymella heteroderae TaxID=1769908 RepID=A0A9P5C1V4_9PLEO|nr:hypothetical protein E8E12_005989 [Didymella heteroderae]
MATVLFMGVAPQDPNIDLPPNVSAQALDVGLNQSVEDMKNAGYQVVLFLPPIMEGINELEKELQKNKYDLVLVGLSIRIVPKHTPYFEGIVNTVLKYNPSQRFAFNASLEGTLEAAQRALPL